MAGRRVKMYFDMVPGMASCVRRDGQPPPDYVPESAPPNKGMQAAILQCFSVLGHVALV